MYRDEARAEQDRDELEQLASAELSYHHARGIRRVLFTLAALLSVAPWLRSLEQSFVPRALTSAAVALWGAALLAALASRVEEWHLRRKWQRCIDRMAATRDS